MERNFLSVRDINRSDCERLIALSEKFLKAGQAKRSDLPPFIVGLLFFAPSTRTQIGFEAATYRLGGHSFTLKETKFEKRNFVAESLEDTIRVVQAYADIICVRHADADVFSRLQAATKPMINCGNGYDEHPTQAVLDLMTIKSLLHRLDNLKVAIVGDLRHMRTAHSLLLALSRFNKIAVRCIAPPKLRMPDGYKDAFKASCNTIEEIDKLDLEDADVVYMAGFAAKTPVGTFGAAIRRKYCMDIGATKQLKDGAIILCPLPRIDEISREVDQTKFAKYFVQSDYGLFSRMAVIADLLG